MRSSRKLVIRRAARRLAHPAQAATAACASRTSVFCAACGRFPIVVCIYIICRYKEIAMLAAPSFRYGVATPEQIAGMTGLQVLQALIDGKLPAPPIAQTLGFWLVEVGDGLAVFEGETGPHVLNPLGIVHGGWALTLIDSATGCAGHTLLPAGASYATIETKANFSRPIAENSGRVRAEGRAIGRGRRIISCEARVGDAKGRLLAHGTSTLMVLEIVGSPAKPAPEGA